MARGIVIEKNGKLGDMYTPSLKFLRGHVVALQNLIPGSEHSHQISNVFCSNALIGSVNKLDVSYLKNVLVNDKSKLKKLWE